MAPVAVTRGAPPQRLLILSLLLFAAFALRVYRLDAVALRGDETFTIRYMGGDPIQTIRDFAPVEPYPAGGFLSVWAWKSVVGDFAFTMRFLPALGDWIGVAAIAALARRLFRSWEVAWLAAGLWAIHPLLIWHAQDARSNYALWAGLSTLALWLFVRAAQRNRRRDWALYLVVEALALYVFFLEAFILAVQALYMAIVRPARPALRRWLVVWAVLGAALIPWLLHVRLLARSGYRGAIEGASLERLLTWIFPTLLVGHEPAAPWNGAIPLLWVALVVISLALRPARIPARIGLWLAAWVLVPAALLFAAATRMNVFHPRYLLAVTPALLLLTARALWPLPPPRPVSMAISSALLLIVATQVSPLRSYYRGEDPKSPDWPAVAAYLQHRAEPDDLILQAAANPSLPYYYRGAAAETGLSPDGDLAPQLRPQVNYYDVIWLVGDGPEAAAYLAERTQLVSVHRIGGVEVTQFRQWGPWAGEITAPAGVVFGEIARLVGYRLQGPDAGAAATVVLLYWEPLAQTEIDYKVFVHLLGPLPHGSAAAPRDQDDDRPLDGFASTRTWQPGVRIRDSYHLLDDPDLALEPGEYELRIGIYDPDSGARLPVIDAAGAPWGDSFSLGTLRWPPP